MTGLRQASLLLALLAALAPIAHVLELPNKLALDGPLWLAVQQHLYRGWGPLLGAPSEVGALAALLSLIGLLAVARCCLIEANGNPLRD